MKWSQKPYYLFSFAIAQVILVAFLACAQGRKKEEHPRESAGRRASRAELHPLMPPTFKRLLKNHFRQVHFRLPEGGSLQRMRLPEQFADNILAAKTAWRNSFRFHEPSPARTERITR
ncbi:hypothetical protein ACUUL3_15725 [Thiovibrio sp. JS02]